MLPKSHKGPPAGETSQGPNSSPGVPAHPDTHKPVWDEASAARASRTNLAWLLWSVSVAVCHTLPAVWQGW